MITFSIDSTEALSATDMHNPSYMRVESLTESEKGFDKSDLM
jgi:hypothetical protein